MSRFAITGTSQLRFRTTDANQKGVFPNASRALSDARRGRFLHSARYARFGRNDKKPPLHFAINPRFASNQNDPAALPFRARAGLAPLPFRARAGPASLSFRARDEARPLVISSAGAKPAPLSFRPEAQRRSGEISCPEYPRDLSAPVPYGTSGRDDTPGQKSLPR